MTFIRVSARDFYAFESFKEHCISTIMRKQRLLVRHHWRISNGLKVSMKTARSVMILIGRLNPVRGEKFHRILHKNCNTMVYVVFTFPKIRLINNDYFGKIHSLLKSSYSKSCSKSCGTFPRLWELTQHYTKNFMIFYLKADCHKRLMYEKEKK